MRNTNLRPTSLKAMSVLLTEWARDLSGTELPADRIPGIMCQVAALQIVLSARLVRDLQTIGETDGDRLLTITEAAERLACSKDWLYRQRLPFTVRNGRQLRYSAHGLDRYIRQQAGRETTSNSTEPER